MKIAMPAFQIRIAPRFDTAREFILVNIRENREVTRQRISINATPPEKKIKTLMNTGIDLLITGGMDNRTQEICRARGIPFFFLGDRGN